MQSIGNKIDILDAFLIDSPYHIISLSELWHNQDYINSIVLSGYSIASSFCRKEHDGGGVCIIVKDNLDFIPRYDLINMSVEFIIEISAIEIPKLNLIIVNLYRADRHLNVFYEQITKLLNLIIRKNMSKNVIVGGDFNINVLEKTKESRDLLNFMKIYNLKQLIKQPTRVTNTSSTCIDLIFTNYTESQSGVNDYGFSDHKSTNIKIAEDQFPYFIQKPQIMYKRVFSNKNMMSFQIKLKEINWNKSLDIANSMNENYEIFNSIIQEILNQTIPIQKIKIRKKQQKNWLTTGLKKSCAHKRALKIILNETNNPTIRKYYDAYSKTLKKAIKKSKKLQYIKQMKKTDNKTKTMWKIINEQTRKTGKKRIKNLQLQINNEIIDCPEKISNVFNEFFATIGEHDAGSPAARGRPVVQPPNCSLFLQPVTPKEVYNIIKNLKNKHSYGIDDIPPTLLKTCINELTYPLSILINQSFETGEFPNLLKISLVKPVHKNGDETIPNQYRPIAILPTFSKVFEKAMSNRMYTFFEKYMIFDDSQNGFRQNRSTTHAVFKYIQTALSYINDKKYALGILLDMSKAYDTVSYNILLSKLYGSGIRGPSYKWFESYLKNRKQIVQIEKFNKETNVIENIKSKEIQLTNSIPQGSVLGCVLFLIYVNDLPKCLDKENSVSVLFADDLSILVKCNKNENYEKKLQDCFETVENWLQDHNLNINYKKTKIIQFRSYQKPNLDINLQIKNTNIDTTNSFCLLGINIDTHLNWKSHIHKIKSKLSQFIYALYQIERSTDTATALTAYYAYAYSLLRYGVMLWGNSVDADQLFIIQKKIIRIISHIKNTQSCKPYFKKLHILTLPCIYIYDISTFVFKNKEKFQQFRDTHNINTRNKNKLYLPPSRIKMLNESPYYMAIKIYNNLPIEITSETNSSKFHSRLKTFLLDRCFYSIQDYIRYKSSDKYDVLS